jgi:hypothetical protein
VNGGGSNDSGSKHDGDEVVDEEGFLLPSRRYDYAGRCWWCGQAADSGEHKYKRTDLVREFGIGPWKGQNAVSHVVSQKPKDLQSPGATGLKFSKILCGTCNSARSQRFDHAYEQFAAYITDEEDRILSETGFRWSDIFGREWKNGRNLVTAYWIKHIGCRLAEGGIEVDPRISEFLDNPGSIRNVPLRMELQIQEDLEALTRHLRQSHGQDFPSLWIGDLSCTYSRSRRRVHQAICHWGIRWLRLTYEFDLEYSRANINFWTDKVHLARFSNIGPESVVQNCHLCR